MSAVAVELVQALIASTPGRAALQLMAAPANELAELMSALNRESAACLLGYLVPVVGSDALCQMEARTAAELLERIGPEHSVILLGRMDEKSSSQIRNALSAPTRDLVDRLLAYQPNQAASRMDPKAPAVARQETVEQALEHVRRAADSALYYVYVVDEEHRLVGLVSMRELMLHPPEIRIDAILRPLLGQLYADDLLESVIINPAWKRSHALPVVDKHGRFLGAMRYSAFRALEAELGQALSGPSDSKTSEALAELLWIGTSAIGRMGGVAILGRAKDDD